MSAVCLKKESPPKKWGVVCDRKDGLIIWPSSGAVYHIRKRTGKNCTPVSMGKIQPVLIPALRTGGFVFSLSLIVDVCIDLWLTFFTLGEETGLISPETGTSEQRVWSSCCLHRRRRSQKTRQTYKSQLCFWLVVTNLWRMKHETMFQFAFSCVEERHGPKQLRERDRFHFTGCSSALRGMEQGLKEGLN